MDLKEFCFFNRPELVLLFFSLSRLFIWVSLVVEASVVFPELVSVTVLIVFWGMAGDLPTSEDKVGIDMAATLMPMAIQIITTNKVIFFKKFPLFIIFFISK